MADVADLITTDPPSWRAIGDGRRLAVMIAAPESNDSVLGLMKLGTGVLGGYRWLSVVEHVRGIRAFRGSRDGSANVGTLTLTLGNRDRRFSPWTPAEAAHGNAPVAFASGTLLRVAAYTPATGWLSIYTGTVESWVPEESDTGRDAWVTVEAVETTSDLARVNIVALDPPVGAQDFQDQRIRRLGDAAGWRFGYDLPPSGTYYPPGADFGPLGATDMASNRLTELYRSAASYSPVSVFRAGRDGRALLATRASLAAVPLPDLTHDGAGVRYVPGTLLPANDDNYVVNYVQLATSGGTVQTYTNETSRVRFGDRTGGRRDLVPHSYGSPLPAIAADLLARGSVTIRPVRCDVTSLHGTPQLDWMIAADLGAVVDVTTPEVTFHDAEIVGLDHRIIPRPYGAVQWTCTVHFGPSATSTWSN